MNEPHLFFCEPCRNEWRLGGFEIEEPVAEHFVDRVLGALREDRQRRRRRWTRRAAAAALLFFFFAAAGRERAATASSGDEQAYAQLGPASDLDELLPE